MDERPQLLQGTLDALILSTLAQRPAHGYAIARAIEKASGGLLAIEEGSLYPALKRLRRAGDVDCEWQTTSTGRRGKVYKLTHDGRYSLQKQRSLWRSYAAAIERVLRGARAMELFDIESTGD